MAPSARSLSAGCYAIVAPDGKTFIESSELRALRKAVALKGTVKFVNWGQAISEATDASALTPRERKPRAPKAQPASEPTMSQSVGQDEPFGDDRAAGSLADPQAMPEGENF